MSSEKSLKNQTVNGLFWSFIDSVSNQGITFVIGIILARILAPKEVGLIGMISIFIAISVTFIESGFSQALIRKKDCSQADYSTVFYFNLAISILFYLILYFTADFISEFYKEPQLVNIIKILGLGLIINAFTIVQRTILFKNIDFKLQTKITIISSVVSGIVGIWMATKGYGVYSLVFKTLCGYFLTALSLWFLNNWKPAFLFKISSFNEMFSFGSKLLASGLINTLYDNFYYLIIGKFFSATELGYFTRADRFNKLPSQTLNNIIQRVTFPTLVLIQNDIPRLKSAYQKLNKAMMLISFFSLFSLAAIAKPMIIVLIGEKWIPAAIYLQLLCFSAIFYPLQSLNLNVLKVLGRSDLYLKLEIIKKALAIPVIIIGVFTNVKIMIIGMAFIAFFSCLISSHFSGKLIKYSILEQFKDISSSFFITLTIAIITYFIGFYVKAPLGIVLILQLLIALSLFVSICELIRIKDYIYIKEIVWNKIKAIILRKMGT
ncbi:MAG: lipopolysaccharide biosynthesis protein [Bacteroidales bacterium]|nr:lipopolysaccharide biosynthesis protein [Bacteroidales bacterium]